MKREPVNHSGKSSHKEMQIDHYFTVMTCTVDGKKRKCIIDDTSEENVKRQCYSQLMHYYVGAGKNIFSRAVDHFKEVSVV